MVWALFLFFVGLFVQGHVCLKFMSKKSHTSLRLFKTPALVSVLHSLMVISVIACLLTGFRLATVSQPIGWLGMLDALLPQGAVHRWHFGLGALLLSVLLVYIGYLFAAKRFSRLALDFSSPRNLFENLLRLSMWASLITLLLSATTGALKFAGVYPGGYETLSQIHHISAIAALAFMAFHVVAAILARGMMALVAIFLPALGKFWHKVSLALAVLVVLAGGLWLLLPMSLQPTLPITLASGPIALDGEAADSAWKQAHAVTVTTVNGHNFPGRQVDVTIKALHDDQYAYFLFRWPDKSRSMKHLPLVKTEEGWSVMQTDFGHADENRFYEDKFAVMLSRTSELAGAGTMGLGHKPLADHPKPVGGRGLHYTRDGSITDVWHWKAVRTGFSIGQADDNHFGRPLPSDSEFLRYTGGYQRDPDCEHKVRWENGDYHLKPECGGYIANWQYYQDGIIEPRRLPLSNKQVRQLDKINLDADAEDYGRWWMNWDETRKYHPDHDDFPVGSVIPSVLSLGPYALGRAGISASATWRDGYWTLEMKRHMQVDSKYDLPIEDGMFFWVAVFNHSQTRHTYHLHPLKLDVQ